MAITQRRLTQCSGRWLNMEKRGAMFRGPHHNWASHHQRPCKNIFSALLPCLTSIFGKFFSKFWFATISIHPLQNVFIALLIWYFSLQCAPDPLHSKNGPGKTFAKGLYKFKAFKSTELAHCLFGAYYKIRKWPICYS